MKGSTAINGFLDLEISIELLAKLDVPAVYLAVIVAFGIRKSALSLRVYGLGQEETGHFYLG